MTAILSYSYKGVPIMIGDLLVSGNVDKPNLVLPTFGDVNQLFGSKPTFAPVELYQKINLIGDKLAVAWAGSRLYASNVIRVLRNEYRGGFLEENDLRSILHKADPEAFKADLSLLFIYITKKGPRSLGYKIEQYPNDKFKDMFAAGTGGEALAKSICGPKDNSYLGEYTDGKKAFIESISSGLALVGGFLQKELLSGWSTLNYYGAGYELLYCLGSRLWKLDDITFMFWSANIDKINEGISISMPQKIIKYSYLDDFLLIRSAKLKDNKLSEQALHIINPVGRTFGKKYSKKLLPRFNSRFYCHFFWIPSIYGKAGVPVIIDYSANRHGKVKMIEKEKKLYFNISEDFFKQAYYTITSKTLIGNV